MTRFRGIFRGALLTLVAGVALAAHHEAPPQAGKTQFQSYCASCHGLDGKGGSPMADSLTKPPADLTKIAARNNGSFPGALVTEMIDEPRQVKLHGTRDMPVRGQELGGTLVGGGGTEARNLRIRGDIQAIVGYLQSIQIAE